MEKNFRQKFQALNRVNLTDAEFMRLRDEIINSDVFASSKHLRERNTFIREDGTPLHYTLVNIKEWCKNEFEVINQLRINTENSHHRYDVILLINGIPVIRKIIETYRDRKEEHRYSKRVSMEEIEKNDFNLNLSRYVSTTQSEKEINLKEVNMQLIEIENRATEPPRSIINSSKSLGCRQYRRSQ